VTPDGEYVLTDTIEAERMRREQTPDLEVVAHPWYEDPAPTLRELTGGAPLGVDAAREGAHDVSHEVDELRWVLDEDAMAQYRQVGADAVDAMSEAAATVQPGTHELEAAAALAAACRRRGMNSPVILAAADERIVRFRHPLPDDAVCRARMMLVVCAERGGLYANLTQFVQLDDLDAETQRRMDASERILRRLREESTRPGRSLAEILDDCKRFYAEEGFPDEWKLHHQGGMTGYASRELVATPDTTYRIRANQAFAWNPSITGGKAEETFLLTESGPEVLAHAR
jgi:Xaa-Pro aminopeptidase